MSRSQIGVVHFREPRPCHATVTFASISYDVDNELTAFAGATYFYDNKWVLLAQRNHEYTTLANAGVD